MIRILLGLIVVIAAGCSTYQSKISSPRNKLKAGQITEALAEFKVLANTPSDDQLIYLLDYATALQIIGQYKESNQVFLQADKLADLQNYYSLSRLTMATLGGEEMTQYKGDSFEVVLISAMLALNYISLGDLDEAMVEVRRLNEKVNKIRLDGRENFEQNPFAHYLMGLIFEADRKYDDAYIAYEKSHKLGGTSSTLAADLLRTAKKSEREAAYKKWKEQFPELPENPLWQGKKNGELVVLFQQGWGPQKIFARGHYRWPDLQPVRSTTNSAQVIVDGQAAGTTSTLYDVEQVAIHTLKEDYGWLAARRLAARVAKEVAADQVRQKNETLGNLLHFAMLVSDRADLRQWSTLPQTVQIHRSWLKAGKYKVKLQGQSGDSPSGEEWPEQEIEIKPGRKNIIVWRALK